MLLADISAALDILNTPVKLDRGEHYPRASELVRELAAHTPAPARDAQWWSAACSGSNSRTWRWPLAWVAREASVQPYRLTSGRLDADEAARVSAVLSHIVVREYGAVIAFASEHAAEYERVFALLGGAGAGSAALAAETVAACATLRAGIVIEPSVIPEDAAAVTPLDAPASRLVLYGKLRCPRCDAVWRPRVPHPRKCPACQVPLTWPDAPAAVAGPAV